MHAQDALGDVVLSICPPWAPALPRATWPVWSSPSRPLPTSTFRCGRSGGSERSPARRPSLANTDPLGVGWFFKVKLSDAAQLADLMDETTYSDFAKNA